MKLKVSLLINFILLILLFSYSIVLAANPNVQINGKIIDFTDNAGNKVEAQIINNRTMVPLRKILEVLNCTVDWNNDTQTVTATKNDKTIILQIGNNEAKLQDSTTNKDETITLDSAPVIVNNRTLVPFRFIGESLDMDVAWDAGANTAIIIDYDSFAQMVKEKSDIIYRALDSKGTNSTLTIEKKYYDDADASNNSNIKLTFGSDYLNNSSSIHIDGNAEIVNEIKNEEWNNIDYNYSFKDDKVLISTPNYAFSSMLGITKNSLAELDSSKFNFIGNIEDSFGDTIKRIIKDDTLKINAGTYSILSKEWGTFLDNFLSSGNKKLDNQYFTYSNIDVSKIFNVITSNPSINSALLLNKAVFRHSGNFKDTLVDYPDITYTFSEQNGKMSIRINMKNEYKERIEYEVILQNS